MMENPTYTANLQLFYKGVACENEKPISTFSGASPCVAIQGHTIAEIFEEPMVGVHCAMDTLRQLQEDAGPLHCLNHSAIPMNMAVAQSGLWNSRVLIPGKDLPATSVWQIKEQCLVGPEAYDQILSMGYNRFIEENIVPRVIDPAYREKYTRYLMEHMGETMAMYYELGIPVVMAGGASTTVPFEQLCGMRSMSQFYMDY